MAGMPNETERPSPHRSSASAQEADPVVRAYLRDVDQTLIRKNLALSVEDRFRQLMQLQAFAAELRRAGASARRP